MKPGGHKWSDEEKQFLIKYYSIMYTGEIAKKLGLTKKQIWDYVSKLRSQGYEIGKKRKSNQYLDLRCE